VQHAIGADITFAFDELTSLLDPYEYQVDSLTRTHKWAERCLAEVERLRKQDVGRPYQALFGVTQGAQHKDLREETARFLGGLPFDGYGLGGAYEKAQMGEIISWMTRILPKEKPRHMLGISEPDDMFAAIEQGADTFDCVSPTRVGRNGAFYTFDGRKNIKGSKFREDFSPLLEGCVCYACSHYTKAYIQHLFRAKESLAGTLMSIHNEHFIIGLVDTIRASIKDGSFYALKESWLKRYYANRPIGAPAKS
jgi:queuine tRNA-ribosyltransferase